MLFGVSLWVWVILWYSGLWVIACWIDLYHKRRSGDKQDNFLALVITGWVLSAAVIGAVRGLVALLGWG